MNENEVEMVSETNKRPVPISTNSIAEDAEAWEVAKSQMHKWAEVHRQAASTYIPDGQNDLTYTIPIWKYRKSMAYMKSKLRKAYSAARYARSRKYKSYKKPYYKKIYRPSKYRRVFRKNNYRKKRFTRKRKYYK